MWIIIMMIITISFSLYIVLVLDTDKTKCEYNAKVLSNVINCNSVTFKLSQVWMFHIFDKFMPSQVPRPV